MSIAIFNKQKLQQNRELQTRFSDNLQLRSNLVSIVHIQPRKKNRSVCKRSTSFRNQYNTYGYSDSYNDIGSTQLDAQFDKDKIHHQHSIIRELTCCEDKKQLQKRAKIIIPLLCPSLHSFLNPPT